MSLTLRHNLTQGYKRKVSPVLLGSGISRSFFRWFGGGLVGRGSGSGSEWVVLVEVVKDIKDS